MLNDYFGFNPTPHCAKYLAVPNKSIPRIIVSLQNYKSFKSGLLIHNTASAKNKIIKKIISSCFPLLKYLNKNVISLKENLLEFLNILQNNLSTAKLHYSAFYIGTSGNANRKITAQISNSYSNVIGILKIPLAGESERFISNELEILKSLKQYDFQSFLYPDTFFLLSESSPKSLFQENIFTDSRQVKNGLCHILVSTSCELALKTANDSNPEYLNKLLAQLENTELDLVLHKLVIQAIADLLETEIPSVLIHGDFVRYNMKVRDDKLALIDWEFARIGLPLFDLFHFVFQDQIQIKKRKTANAIKEVFSKQNLKLYKDYLLNLNIQDNRIKSLFILYLFDNLLFEKRLKPKNEIDSSNFYQALQIMRYELNGQCFRNKY